MRIGNILIHPIDTSGGNEFVIIDESTGNEISFSEEIAWELFLALGNLLIPNEPDLATN